MLHDKKRLPSVTGKRSGTALRHQENSALCHISTRRGVGLRSFIGVMGAYLSSPITTKNGHDGEGSRLRYGVSDMQGWRMHMEVCRNALSVPLSQKEAAAQEHRKKLVMIGVDPTEPFVLS